MMNRKFFYSSRQSCLYLLSSRNNTAVSSRSFSRKTHYRVLNISQTASKKEIRDAYIKLSKQYHPDLNKDNSSCHEQFINIKKAYDVLSDPVKRSQYDSDIVSGFHRNKTKGDYSDYTDIHQNAYYSDPYKNMHGHRYTDEEKAYWENYHRRENRLSVIEMAVAACLVYGICMGYYYCFLFFLKVERKIFVKNYKSDIERIVNTDHRYWTTLDRRMVDEYLKQKNDEKSNGS